MIDTASVYENEADVGLALQESGVPRAEAVMFAPWFWQRQNPGAHPPRSVNGARRC